VTVVEADPGEIRLQGPAARRTLLVSGRTAEGRLVDLTREAAYRSGDTKVATVSGTGVVRPLADGVTRVAIEVAGRALEVSVRVEGMAAPRRFNFENDIVPVLGRLGCNASGCHGKAEGQNGFKLSVFGSDPVADHVALTRESRGRRVFPAAPERSLLLTKITGAVPHGGGVRTSRDSAEYETLRAWVAAGMPVGRPEDPHVESIRVEPRERQMTIKAHQQLRVVAHYSDGHEADVTALARFQSNQESLATVAPDGLVTMGEVPGAVAVMASFLGAADAFRALVPREGPSEDEPTWHANNFIDDLVARRLKTLNVRPSPEADDATFLRRISLDLVGTLPTPDEARRFLSDSRPDRRARLVDELFERPEFADYWALKWADVLRVDREALGRKRAYGYYRWIRDSVAANMPYDQFARAVLTAEGPLDEVGPASFYKVVPKPGDAASTLSQVFLGVRIACAECHHHPYDRWGQDDYFGMAAYFAPVAVTGGARAEELMARGQAVMKHPRTGGDVPAHSLASSPTPAPDSAEGDRRAVLARWMTAPENPWFARNLANRLWAHFLGRGLVEPVDDVRATNPPSDPDLLDALGRYLVDHKFDVRELMQAIVASRTYQASSEPNATNARDELNASRALLRRVEAEVLLDMVCQTTGVPEKFPGVPGGYRAIQLWDSKVPHYFLNLFGRPVRSSACECERNAEPSVGQVLHLLNAPGLHAKLAEEDGSIARLVRRVDDGAALVEELYLMFYSRFPTADERSAAVDFLRAGHSRREAAEDLAWSLMNTLEFLFNH
jgi:hypothetical protein